MQRSARVQHLTVVHCPSELRPSGFLYIHVEVTIVWTTSEEYKEDITCYQLFSFPEWWATSPPLPCHSTTAKEVKPHLRTTDAEGFTGQLHGLKTTIQQLVLLHFHYWNQMSNNNNNHNKVLKFISFCITGMHPPAFTVNYTLMCSICINRK